MKIKHPKLIALESRTKANKSEKYIIITSWTMVLLLILLIVISNIKGVR